jgi:4-hydroxybenzoate polyprenyltransferase
MAHLGINDLADVANDYARGMKTIPVLYGPSGVIFWIYGFTLFHILGAALFFPYLGTIARSGMIAGLLLLCAANGIVMLGRDPDSAMKALPLFHVAMVVYAGTILLGAVP